MQHYKLLCSNAPAKAAGRYLQQQDMLPLYLFTGQAALPTNFYPMIWSCCLHCALQACLFKLPLQGHFEGPATPIYIPNARSNSRSSSSNSGHQTKQASAECPPGGGQPNRLTLAGILYQPAAPSVDQLRSIVSLLRQHLSSSPPHASWWHLQLSEAFEALGSTQLAEQQLYAAYDAATSRRLAAAAMYKLAELRIGAGDMQGAIAAAARGIARHVTPDLLWIAALASYRAANDQAAISWSEMAARVACAEGVCSVDRPAAFADVATWYEKPYDVMRWAYKRLSSQQSSSAAAEAAAERSWAAAAALREQQVAGNSSSRFIVLGLQALPLLQLQEGIEVRALVLQLLAQSVLRALHTPKTAVGLLWCAVPVLLLHWCKR
jgi:hypothetical protein